MKNLYIISFIFFSSIALSQVGIGKTNPNFILDINAQGQNLNGVNIEQTAFNIQLFGENNTNTLVLNNTSSNALYNYRFRGTTRFIYDEDSFRPAVNSNNNVTAGGIDIGRFDSHFRRVYTQGIHTNDNGANGGLRINIGSGGGNTADYIFSDFAFYPVVSQARELGRNGNFWRNVYSVNYFTPSDERLKENIKPNTKGLETLKQINTFQYNYIADKSQKMHFGVMAQELKEFMPELVHQSKTGDLVVNYIEMVHVLIKAIQEEQVIIKQQAEKIEKLESEIAMIKEKLGV